MEFRDHSGIGTLHHFIALKHLGIQSQILLGEWDRLIEGDDDDVIYDETLYQDMKVDWSDFKKYIAEEQWQNVARVLTEMALSEHRNISVKHGSPQGSRSWGETATEPRDVPPQDSCPAQ